MTMDIMEASIRQNAKNDNFADQSDRLVLDAIDRFRTEAPSGYRFGYAAGQALPMYGIGGAAAGPLAKALKNPYVREAAIGAVTNAAPTLVSGVAQGKPAGQIALETANNAGTGAYYGLGMRYLGEMLPQPGTIAYRELEGRGGWRRTAAPLVGRIAQVLNPEGAAAVDEFRLGNDKMRGYNNLNSGASSPVGQNTNSKRVGRWMSQEEYEMMRNTGRVQESFTGTTHVAYPNNLESFARQAKPGSIYVEFDLPESYLKQTDLNNGWSKIIGPNSLEGRLAARKGKPVHEMPEASNIEIVGRK